MWMRLLLTRRMGLGYSLITKNASAPRLRSATTFHQSQVMINKTKAELLEHIRMEDIEKDVLIDLVYKHEVTIHSLRNQLNEIQIDTDELEKAKADFARERRIEAIV